MSSADADPVLVQLLAKIEERTATILEKVSQDRFALLQQQLGIIERQLNAVSTLVSQSFQATLNPEALAQARKEAEDQAAAIDKQLRDEEAAILESRRLAGIGNDGDAVTEADIREAEYYRQA